jgi:outer membrane murein-binding lipoprotein Lpp
MAIANVNTKCLMCPEKTSTFLCNGCSENFCFNHLTEHRQSLNTQLHHIQNDYNQFKQIIIDIKNNPRKHPLINGKKNQLKKLNKQQRNVNND